MDKVLSTTITADSNAETEVALPLSNPAVEGFFSYSAVVTGSGTAKIEYMVPTTFNKNQGDISAYGGFIVPAVASEIATGLTSGSYAGDFSVIPTQALKFKVTETGSSNSVTIDLYIIIK